MSRFRGATAPLVSTWPRKLTAVFATAAIGSLATAFAAGLWSTASKRIGHGSSALLVTVVRDRDAFDSGSVNFPEFIFRRPISAIGRPPSGGDWRGRWKWAHDRGGIDAKSSMIRVVVQGRSEAQVTLQRLEVDVLQRRRPIEGTDIAYTGLGGGEDVRHVNIDLDSDPPQTNGFGHRAPEVLRVSASDAEVFNLLATTHHCDCTWVAKLHYVGADGKPGFVTIDDHGDPFRTTARERSHTYSWADWDRPPRWTPGGAS